MKLFNFPTILKLNFWMLVLVETLCLSGCKKDSSNTKIEKSHVSRLSKGKCDPVVGIIFIEMLAKLEKIGDHLSNIAERTPEIQDHYFEIG